jgi:hypothetical protein
MPAVCQNCGKAVLLKNAWSVQFAIWWVVIFLGSHIYSTVNKTYVPYIIVLLYMAAIQIPIFMFKPLEYEDKVPSKLSSALTITFMVLACLPIIYRIYNGF